MQRHYQQDMWCLSQTRINNFIWQNCRCTFLHTPQRKREWKCIYTYWGGAFRKARYSSWTFCTVRNTQGNLSPVATMSDVLSQSDNGPQEDLTPATLNAYFAKYRTKHLFYFQSMPTTHIWSYFLAKKVFENLNVLSVDFRHLRCNKTFNFELGRCGDRLLIYSPRSDLCICNANRHHWLPLQIFGCKKFSEQVTGEHIHSLHDKGAKSHLSTKKQKCAPCKRNT